MPSFIIEGTITQQDASAIVTATKTHFADAGDVQVSLGARLHEAGGVDPALTVALCALAIQVVDFCIRLWDRHHDGGKTTSADQGELRKEFASSAPTQDQAWELVPIDESGFAAASSLSQTRRLAVVDHSQKRSCGVEVTRKESQFTLFFEPGR